MGLMCRCAVFLFALCSFPGTLAWAEKVKPCDAKPRWLLVTVLAAEIRLAGLPTKQGQRIRLPRTPRIYPKGRLWLLDRCKTRALRNPVIRLDMDAYPGDRTAEAAGEDRQLGIPQEALTLITILSRDTFFRTPGVREFARERGGEGGSNPVQVERLWVKESLRDLCRAMKDCGDATSKQ